MKIAAVVALLVVSMMVATAYAQSSVIAAVDTPQNFKAQSMSTSYVMITWDPVSQVTPADTRSGYYLLKKTDNTDWVQLGSEMPMGYQQTYYKDTHVQAGRTYSYKIVAYTSKAQSYPSEPISISVNRYSSVSVSVTTDKNNYALGETVSIKTMITAGRSTINDVSLSSLEILTPSLKYPVVISQFIESSIMSH